jgi:DNA processing protein
MAVYYGEAAFPKRLKEMHDPPAFFFYLGDLEILSEKTVSIVGSRQFSELGRWWLREEVPLLVERGITTISGGANGIDTLVHEFTVKAGGLTCVVLPGGLDKLYPSANHKLFQQIKDLGGLLFSEFWPGTSIQAHNFHRRNRLISGLSKELIVVEAARKSGTMITAQAALKDGRSIFVLPGPPALAQYQGSLDLLGEGAKIIRSVVELECAAPH